MLIRRFDDLVWRTQANARGGDGVATSAPYLATGDMAAVSAAGCTVLEPGSSVGEHLHADTDELYLILEGHGTGSLDGQSFPVTAGDLFVVRAGHAHGLVNDGAGPLAFFGLITAP